jgi:hypothetical protein
VNQYEEPSTPELDDLQQNNEREAAIEVPVRVVDIGSVQVHTLPAREAVMRALTVVADAPVMQIVGGDLRRMKLTTWVRGVENGDFIYMGVDKNEVESETAAQIFASSPVAVSDTSLIHTHCLPVWVKNTGTNDVVVSFLAEYWAD